MIYSCPMSKKGYIVKKLTQIFRIFSPGVLSGFCIVGVVLVGVVSSGCPTATSTTACSEEYVDPSDRRACNSFCSTASNSKKLNKIDDLEDFKAGCLKGQRGFLSSQVSLKVDQIHAFCDDVENQSSSWKVGCLVGASREWLQKNYERFPRESGERETGNISMDEVIDFLEDENFVTPEMTL